ERPHRCVDSKRSQLLLAGGERLQRQRDGRALKIVIRSSPGAGKAVHKADFCVPRLRGAHSDDEHELFKVALEERMLHQGLLATFVDDGNYRSQVELLPYRYYRREAQPAKYSVRCLGDMIWSLALIWAADRRIDPSAPTISTVFSSSSLPM